MLESIAFAEHDLRSNYTNTQIGATQGPVAIAPNGIANAAPNLGSQTVNNFGPPPIQFTWETRDVVPPMEGEKPSQYKYEKELTVTPSATYTPVSIAVFCDSELEAVRAYPAGGGAEFSSLMSLAATDRRIALVYYGGTPATPSRPIIVRVWANQPFTVLKVVTARIKSVSD